MVSDNHDISVAFALTPLLQSIVNIRNIQLLNNPARWEDEYNFRITFECVEPLKEGEAALCTRAENKS